MADFFYVLRLFYVKDRSNALMYLITSLLSTPILFAELFTTKAVVELIQHSTNYSYVHILFLVSLLMLFLYLAGINGSLRAISSTNLTAISVYELEHSMLEKTSKLTMALLENPSIKSQREKAKRLSLFNLLDQWVGVGVNVVALVALLIVISGYGFYTLGLIIVVVLIVQLYISKWISQKVEAAAQKQTSSARVINYLIDLLISRDTLQEVRIYRMSTYLYNQMKVMFFRNYKQMQRKVIQSEAIAFSQRFFMILLNGFTIAILVITLANKGLGAGLFVLLLQISSQLFIVIPTLTTQYSELAISRMRYQEYRSYLELEEQVLRDHYPTTIDATAMQVRINNLTFRYVTNAQDSLRNINMNIKPGERVAFVGENGSGKSTLVKLILGLYRPSAGSIQWFKGDNEVSANGVTQEIRVVFQDFTKLLRPIRENLALGNIDSLHDTPILLDALAKAEAHHDATELDTMLGPQFGGVDLSGGQWQRLAIARAYLNKGALTIFDEPTAALDPYAEQKAFDTFTQLGANQTSIIVTHRLYMSKFVDKIFLFEHGEIVESGTHEELMSLEGKYRSMFNLQSSLYV